MPEFKAVCFCVCAELRPVCFFSPPARCTGQKDHLSPRQTMAASLYPYFAFGSLGKNKKTVCTVVLAFFGHINPDAATVITGSFSVAQQRSGSTPEPRFLAEGLFFVCKNRKTSKWGTGLELPQLKRGNSVLPYCFHVLISHLKRIAEVH